MEILDERILESLQDYGPSPPSIMVAIKGIKGSEEEIYKRCKRLQEEGLIEQFDGNSFRITGLGELYLDGHLDLAEHGGSRYEIILNRNHRNFGSQRSQIRSYINGICQSSKRYHIRESIQSVLRSSN